MRECTIVPGNDTDSALVEFQTAESVPDALDKDHKKLDSSEIRVTMLWRSTLFVTNFSKDTDDKGIRKLFEQVGVVWHMELASLFLHCCAPQICARIVVCLTVVCRIFVCRIVVCRILGAALVSTVRAALTAVRHDSADALAELEVRV